MISILAIIDPSESIHSALERCTTLAASDDLEIHAVAFVAAESASKLSNEYQTRTDWIEELVQPYRDKGYKITTGTEIFTRLYESILNTAKACKADLIFKPARHHSLVRQLVLTSTDWNLIRLCEQPLLLVNNQEPVQRRPVIAAVDACPEDDAHNELNAIVIEQAKAVAEVLGSEVVLVNAWSVSSVVMASAGSTPVPYQIVNDKSKDHLTKTLELADQYGIDHSKVYVHEGSPEWVIKEVGKEINASVAVVGTVARKGVSGLLVGNTAETVLEGSDIDVMVVKHPSFQSPLASRAA